MAETTLHLLAGKAASGKSTLAATLAARHGAIVLSEDHFLASLYGEEIADLEDYVRRSERLKAALTPHVLDLLAAGVSIVLDFPGNTPGQRRWMRGLIDRAGRAHVLHFLDIPDAVCKARLRIRNAGDANPFKLTEARFDVLARHFVPPSEEEGFVIVRYEGDIEPG